MSRARPLLVPAEPTPRTVQIRVDEALVEARPEDTLATALIAAGSLMTSRSPKYRRPRGAYCLSGDCGTCLVRVDGRPNVRACTTPVREGMRVSSQNTYRPRRLDPTQLVDAMFRQGMDHHHLMVHPRIANQVMQEVARNLAGYGELPEGADERRCEHLEHELPVVIVGAGPAGRAAARVLAERGVPHLLIDRKDRRQLDAELERDEFSPTDMLFGCGVFGVYADPRAGLPAPAPGRMLLAASELIPAIDSSPEIERLHGFRPRHLILALGTREPMLPFANDDLPGIVGARGLLLALRRAKARIDGPCVVVGEGERAERLTAALDELRSPGAPKVERVSPDRIERAIGGTRIEALVLRDRRLPCALLALAAPPAPAHELASAAGAAVRFDGSGFAVVRDEQGRCARLDGSDIWACGDLVGYMGVPAAARDGERIATHVADALAGEPEALAHVRVVATREVARPTLTERPVVGDAFADDEDDADDDREEGDHHG
ncbi:2Fe-2S iron-sulfur cluster-binding protein [Nannocystaceae bacterium ST9]